MGMDGSGELLADRRSGARRSKQILDAAEHCVQRLGFHNASMAEIAMAAGMSVGHIYRYFPGKEAIIIAIVERDAAQTLREVEDLERDPGGLRAALRTYARRLVDRCAAPTRVALRLEIMAEAARNPRVANVMRQAFGEVRGQVLALMRRDRSDLSEADVQRQMQAFDLILSGLPMMAVKFPALEADAMAELAVDCINRMISAEPEVS